MPQPRRGLLLDLDDTLYDYEPANSQALDVLFGDVARHTGLSEESIRLRWGQARSQVKQRLGRRGSAHSRLLYLHELLHAANKREHLPKVRGWDRLYWDTLVRLAPLRDGALDLLRSWRLKGGKIAIVTNLTLEVQLFKLEHYRLAPLIDALAVSEEVAEEKPRPALFELGMARIGLKPEDCFMVGDDPKCDGEGAALFGMPYYRTVSTHHREGGLTLRQLTQDLGL